MSLARILIASSVAVVGCGAPAVEPAYFRPTERVLAETARGEKMAIYDVATSEGSIGEVRLWSNGADRGIVDRVERTLVHVAFTIQNDGSVPLTLDVDRLQLAVAGTNARLTAVAGEPVIPSASVRTVDLYFELAGTDPRKLRSFALDWTLRANDRSFHRRTPFGLDPDLRPISGGGKLPQPVRHRYDRVVIVNGHVATRQPTP